MKEYKITVIGDIMGELPVLLQAEKPDGTYDFLPTFAPLKSYFDEADYGIGNLETVLAGKEAGYTPDIVSFNTPDCIAEALKAIGINAVTTANNHIMDRDITGLRRTPRVLDAAGLAHTGTYDEIPEDKNLYFTVGDTKVALLSYTTSCNESMNKGKDFSTVEEHANFLRPYNAPGARLPEDPSVARTFKLVEDLLGRKLNFEEKAQVRAAIGQPVAFADDRLDLTILAPYMEQVKADYERARKKADVVLICPHSGGQFNTRPGWVSEWFFARFADMGFDAVLAAHSHTTQCARKIGNTVTFCSLGNVTMSPHTGYSVKESLPQYGIAAHLYLCGGKISRTAFSLFKMVEPEGERLRAVPVDELLESLPDGMERAQTIMETAEVYTRITGRPFEGIKREWELF